jgi:hypothetical protein
VNLRPVRPGAFSGEAGGAPRARFPLRLVLFGALALVAVYVGFIWPTVDQARQLVQRTGYFVMAGTVFWATLALVRIAPAWWEARPALSRRQTLGIATTIGLLTLVAALTVPYTYKVLYDEFVLQSTAWNMHAAREVGTAVRGYEIEGAFVPFGNYLDKRPFFYAFVLSLLHDLTGYREANAFALNTALMPLVLGLLYLVTRRLTSHGPACVAVVSLGAYSLLAHNATGAGMEMLNLAMVLLVIELAWFFLRAPDGPRLEALVLAAVLLAQARYESGLYVAPVALIVLEGWRRAGRILLPAAAAFAPALLVPYALHNTYLSGTPLLWELRAGDESRFGLQYLGDNLVHALRFFFNYSSTVTNSWWLGVAGIPALAWAAWRVLRAGREWRTCSAAALAVTVFGGAITAGLTLLMFYYWGQLDDPIVSRLSLPFSALLAIALALAAARLPRWTEARWSAVLIGGALFSYLTVGLKVNAQHWELHLLEREIAWEKSVLASRPRASRLLISNKSPLYWITRETPVISIARARWRAPAVKYHVDARTFDEVLVFQIYRPAGADAGFQLEAEDRLPAAYVLETVAERRFGSRIARISRVVDIQAGEAPVAATAAPAS